jgi:transcriptional regulator with XRE-family HTH domain
LTGAAMMKEVKRAPYVVFGQNVCRLRTAAKLTQESLAEKADLSRRFVQEIEAGDKSATINTVVRLKKALACSWNDLFVQTDE